MKLTPLDEEVSAPETLTPLEEGEAESEEELSPLDEEETVALTPDEEEAPLVLSVKEIANNRNRDNVDNDAGKSILRPTTDTYKHLGSPTEPALDGRESKSDQVDAGALLRPPEASKESSIHEKIYFGLTEFANNLSKRSDDIGLFTAVYDPKNIIEAIEETFDAMEDLPRKEMLKETVENIKGMGFIGPVVKNFIDAIPFTATAPEVEEQLNYFEKGQSDTASLEDKVLGYTDVALGVAFPLIRDYFTAGLFRPLIFLKGAGVAAKTAGILSKVTNSSAASFIFAGAAHNALKATVQTSEYAHHTGREDVNPYAMGTVSFLASLASGLTTNAIMSEFMQPVVAKLLRNSSIASKLSAGAFGATENIADMGLQTSLENIARRKAELPELQISGFEASLAAILGAGFSMASNYHYVKAVNEKTNVNPDGYDATANGGKTDAQLGEEGGMQQLEKVLVKTMVEDPKTKLFDGVDLSGKKILKEEAEGTINEVLLEMAKKYNVHKEYNATDVEYAETLIKLSGKMSPPKELETEGNVVSREESPEGEVLEEGDKIKRENNVKQRVNAYVKHEADFTNLIEFQNKISKITAEQRTTKAREELLLKNGIEPTEKELHTYVRNHKKEDSTHLFFENYIRASDDARVEDYLDEAGITNLAMKKIAAGAMTASGDTDVAKKLKDELTLIKEGGEDFKAASKLMSDRYTELLHDYVRYTKYNSLRNLVARKTTMAMMDINDLDPTAKSIFMGQEEFHNKTTALLTFGKAFHKTEMEIAAAKAEEYKQNRSNWQGFKDFLSATFDGVTGLEVMKHWGVTGMSANTFMDSLNRIFDNVTNPYFKEQLGKTYSSLGQAAELSISMSNVQGEFIENFKRRLKSKPDTSENRIRLYSDELSDIETQVKTGTRKNVELATLEYDGIEMVYSKEAQMKSQATPEEMYLAHKISSFMHYRETKIVNPVNGKVAYDYATALQNTPRFYDNINLPGSYIGKTYSPVTWNNAGVKHLEIMKDTINNISKNPNIAKSRNIDTIRKDYTLRENLVTELHGDMLRARWRILNLNVMKEMQTLAMHHYGVKIDDGRIKPYTAADIDKFYIDDKSDLNFAFADMFKLAEDSMRPATYRSDSKFIQAEKVATALHRLKGKFLTSGLNVWYTAMGPSQSAMAGVDIFGLYGLVTAPKAYKMAAQYALKYKFDVFSMVKDMESSGIQTQDAAKIGLAKFLKEKFPYKGQKFYIDYSDAIDNSTAQGMHDDLMARGYLDKSADTVVSLIKGVYNAADNVAEKANNAYDAAEVGTRSHGYILGRGLSGKIIRKNLWETKNLQKAVAKLDQWKKDLWLDDSRVFESIERTKLNHLLEDAVAKYVDSGKKDVFETFLHEYGSSVSLALNFEYNQLTRPGALQKIRKFGTTGKMIGMFTTYTLYNRKNAKRMLSLKDSKSAMGLLNLAMMTAIGSISKEVVSEEFFGKKSIMPRLVDTYWWSRIPVLSDLQFFVNRSQNIAGFAGDAYKPFYSITRYAYAKMTGNKKQSDKYLDDFFNYISPLRIMKIPGLTFDGLKYVEDNVIGGLEKGIRRTSERVERDAREVAEILNEYADKIAEIGQNIGDSDLLDFSGTFKSLIEALKDEPEELQNEKK